MVSPPEWIKRNSNVHVSTNGLVVDMVSRDMSEKIYFASSRFMPFTDLLVAEVVGLLFDVQIRSTFLSRTSSLKGITQWFLVAYLDPSTHSGWKQRELSMKLSSFPFH